MATTGVTAIRGVRTIGPEDQERIERRTREIGRELFARVARASRPWRRAWWEDRFMGATLDDPEVRVQLFRFIDVLPALRGPSAVRRHLAEYLGEAGDRVPWWLRSSVAMAPPGSGREALLARSATAAAEVMARKFIAGATPDEALQTVLRLRARRVAFTADLLGEAVVSEREADAYQQTCLDLIRGLAGPLAAQPEIPLIDRDADGPIPRVNLSLKLSSLTTWFDPISPSATIDRVAARLRPILRAAREAGAYVHVDMEQYDYRALSYDLFESVLSEPEFGDWPDVGIVVQAYQPDAEAEILRLDAFVARRGAPITVRLVKGAYWDYEVLTARRHGWPEPVFLEKWRTDANYERCTNLLMERRANLRPAIASHNLRSLAHAIATAEALGLPIDAYELQTLHGMGDAIDDALVERGCRVRVYTPYGAMLPGMAYLVRRLLENTSNESFLKASGASGVAVDELLRDPEEAGAMRTLSRRSTPKAEPAALPDGLPPFRNQPVADFAKAENREAMAEALRQVESELGRTYPLILDGEAVTTPDRLAESLDPSRSARVVGKVSTADAGHADRALAAARAAVASWSAEPVEARAAVLVRAAALMRSRRFELAAWEVFECGKPWREADADVAEAIDFCEFYAREMIRLAEPRRRDVPGETNVCDRLPRGVVVVVPPWNFPLAIPCGMTVAPLVAGNAVILKPAEQSPIVAAKLVEILREAGAPSGALQFLPGEGEEVGQALVNDRRVDVVSFTGSREVGLLLNRQAADTPPGQDHVKRVIAEMGGKNAVIVDDDADLDEAVVGVLQSAFGYAGQKCSACSRVVVLEGVYDAFVARLAEAGKALLVGPADDPDTFVGPVIDAEARKRILEYRAIAGREGRVVLDVDVSATADLGSFVGPLIVADVAPDARVAQEEIFGPILAVLKAKDLAEALAIADGTSYALTGGLYSRSPATIDRVRREFRVGNLYINRMITGALVDRQPFGGFKLSGVGAKAGGSEYLLEFLLTRSITENTMRRGFAPEDLSVASDDESTG
ncbi:L-glutamate gamma-semialdehyde dehydrogenase [Planctomyces sp. SH-PL62]|uniref:L-glutamate gamma-semialdehyde dehydrogenase n=1 Tax=Planctomyces sp. SH-PL62 TaxID=1636152 RepID=UPI00078E17C0|nr:L-glutamate gamma-semialdehyde dehydrogenase [Planctomyces sp. SH-PL62]AMV40597.1 1-pyrroline-5-carboxylate dehydrogenase 1 [Planctomyces sp. SH-PL62]